MDKETMEQINDIIFDMDHPLGSAPLEERVETIASAVYFLAEQLKRILEESA